MDDGTLHGSHSEFCVRSLKSAVIVFPQFIDDSGERNRAVVGLIISKGSSSTWLNEALKG